MRCLALIAMIASCAGGPRPFPLRAPVTRDPDLDPVSVACRPDPSPKEPKRISCAPAEYVSPFIWDQVDNILFARLSRGLSVNIAGEAVNVNALDEVPDSAWFTNRPRESVTDHDDGAPGACKPDDILPAQDQVADGAWVIDKGKDNGSSGGFRVTVPGKGLYLLKSDDVGFPEQASGASVIGAALYDAIGFNTACEQIVVVRKTQLKLTPGLTVSDNTGLSRPFDDKALETVLSSATQVPGHLVRFQASKWLPGLTIGPFHYDGTRDDDPADVIPHQDRRELRGSRVLAAWMNHWDSREQNSMDVWMADDAKHKRSSPGHVVHYIIDTSDAFGALGGPRALGVMQGYSYEIDFPDILRALVTFGLDERPWDRAAMSPGHERFNYFRLADFDPDRWKGSYPNPAFLAASERDRAWMARLIARFSKADLRRIIDQAKFSGPTDAAWLTDVMVGRQQRILARYLMKLSPLGEIRAAGPDRICATDFARLREVVPASRFHYAVVERAGHAKIALVPELGEDGAVCFTTRPLVAGDHRDGDPEQRVTLVVDNGTGAHPLVIHAYDLGARGMRIAGVTRD